jgi:hypothetical protein
MTSTTSFFYKVCVRELYFFETAYLICPSSRRVCVFSWRSGKGVLESRSVTTAPYLVTGPGSRHGLGAQPGVRSLTDRHPCKPMASSQGDVLSSPMAYPAVRPLPKLPLPPRLATRALPLVRLRVWPERNRAQSCAIALRSPAPERSRPPTLNDIHQIF